jgi:NitT/TauT family transport system permease protein
MAILGFIASLLVDISFSWLRMLVALLISILLGLSIGIYAARNRLAEKVIMPIVDVLQTLPILAFFPFVILVIVGALPGYVGINAAVIFLIVTSMVWNIIFGAYEAVKTLPNEVLDVSKVYQLGGFGTLRKILLPASMPKVVEQSMLSWSIGLFYLVTSEIFSTASSTYTVKYGIGVALTNLALSGNYFEYAIGIVVFIIFVVLTRALLFAPLERLFSRYSEPTQARAESRFAGLVRRFRLHSTIRLHWPARGKAPERRYMAGKEAAAPDIGEMHAHSMVARIALIVAVLLALALLYATGVINAQNLGYEYSVLVALAASFARIWFAFAVILLISVPVSIYLIFMSKHSSAYVTLFQVIASIPATILLPLIVLSFRSYPMHDELVAFVIFVMSGLWYMIFSIMANRSYIQGSVLEVKRLFKVRGINAWKSVYLKAIVPGLITGGITAIAAEWNASIVAEQFTSTAIGSGTPITSVGIGMGKFLDVQLGAGHLWLMALALINLTAMIIIINRLLWKRMYGRVAKIYA